MDYGIIVSAGALIVSAVAFFYGIGRDSKDKGPPDDSKLDQLISTVTGMNQKLDNIAEWQREAAGIHASHGEKIKTLFNRVENLESRMEDRGVMIEALQKILEKVG